MDERYHNNDDDILHKSINMIWKLLDPQNKGVIDEQYYIYQLKMLDKIMNYNTNNNNGYSSKKIIKHSPSYNHFKKKRSHSISPTRFKRHTGEFFHVHQLSPRTSETMKKFISPRPPMSSRTRKQGRKHQKGRFVKKTDKNDEELQSYIQNKRLN